MSNVGLAALASPAQADPLIAERFSPRSTAWRTARSLSGPWARFGKITVVTVGMLTNLLCAGSWSTYCFCTSGMKTESQSS